MGNATGAFVAVQIDAPGTHYGGKTVRGKVYLDVQKSSVSADSLNIRFYGQEHSRVVRGKKRAFASKLFYDVDYQLCSYDENAVQNGRYEYPFEIKLPLNLPGKQRCSHFNRNSFHAIDYHVEARLHRHGMLTWDVKNSMEVLMLDPPYDRIPTPVFSPPSTVPIHKYCCIPSGTMALAVKLDSNNIVESEAFRVFYEINNKSTCQVKALEISVHQTFKCQAGVHRDYNHVSVFHQRIDSSRLQNSSPIEVAKDNNNNSLSIGKEEIRMMVDSLAKGNNFLEVTIPASRISVPSFTGSCSRITIVISSIYLFGAFVDDSIHYSDNDVLFLGILGSVSYCLRVQIKTPFGVEDPRIECPIILHRTAFSFEHVVPAVEHEFTLPPDWKSMKPSALVQFELPR